MKQLTIVFHYDSDESAKKVYDELRLHRKEPEKHQVLVLGLEGVKIVGLNLEGPNDS